jgi:hypothetical protein
VSPATLTVLKPVLRYSASRDAYVLRGVGNRVGPVLRPRVPSAGDDANPAQPGRSYG